MPVIIAGAGPCGLVAALTLQNKGIPFVLYERASREKVCSNAGSGFDMAPTAVDILRTKLCVDMKKAMRPYEHLYVGDMKGRHVNTFRFEDMSKNARDFGFANRSDLQNALLDSIMQDKTDEEQNAILKCKITVSGYSNKGNHVEVKLSDGTTVKGTALLACDGIHSSVRKHMHRDVNDDFHYCGQECWWGKTTIQPGSKLDLELNKVEKGSDMKGSVAISLVGDRKRPGAFFSGPVGESTHAWVYVVKQKQSPLANQTNDLVRRGGTILTEEAKHLELEKPITNRSKLLRQFIRETPASDITRTGLFDRKNLKLPFVDRRVALLGDAAHPQSPMMGQGANMAIVDGYVVASRLAAAKMNDNSNIVTTVLADYDCDVRRKGIKKVIDDSRKYGNFVVSSNPFTCWTTKMVLKCIPPSLLMKEMVRGDKSNKKFVEAMDSAKAALKS